jgi:hypothetical protein
MQADMMTVPRPTPLPANGIRETGRRGSALRTDVDGGPHNLHSWRLFSLPRPLDPQWAVVHDLTRQ